MRNQTGNKGFTLIELLIVIGIIGFLAAAVLVAVDPVKRIQDSRNARRFSEVNAILNAILTKQVDDTALYNGGPGANIITGTDQVIVSSTVGIDCDTPASAPSCPGQSLSLADGHGCVVNLGDGSTNTGALSGTISSVGTAVTGTNTYFTSQVRAGDVITDGTSTCTVSSVTNDTALVCTVAPAPAFSADAVTATRTNSAISPNYIAVIPTDPAGGTPTAGNLALGATNSGYYLHRNAGNRIEIGACHPEQSATINVQR